ncbi:hypothetical protein V8E53_012374 [Lactarius tabidus]
MAHPQAPLPTVGHCGRCFSLNSPRPGGWSPSGRPTSEFQGSATGAYRSQKLILSTDYLRISNVMKSRGEDITAASLDVNYKKELSAPGHVTFAFPLYSLLRHHAKVQTHFSSSSCSERPGMTHDRSSNRAIGGSIAQKLLTHDGSRRLAKVFPSTEHQLPGPSDSLCFPRPDGSLDGRSPAMGSSWASMHMFQKSLTVNHNATSHGEMVNLAVAKLNHLYGGGNVPRLDSSEKSRRSSKDRMNDSSGSGSPRRRFLPAHTRSSLQGGI